MVLQQKAPYITIIKEKSLKLLTGHQGRQTRSTMIISNTNFVTSTQSEGYGSSTNFWAGVGETLFSIFNGPHNEEVRAEARKTLFALGE